MGNKDRDVFDLGDFNDSDFDSSFGGSGLTEDIDLTPTEVITTQGGRNTRFILLATVLVLLILIGAIGIILLAIDAQLKNQAFQQTAQAVYATNTAVRLAALQTDIAKSWTPTPTYTFTPTDTPTSTPTETPTATPTEDIPATQTAAAETLAALIPPQQTATAAALAAQQTATAAAQQATDAAGAALTATANAANFFGTQTAVAQGTLSVPTKEGPTAVSQLPTTPAVVVVTPAGGGGGFPFDPRTPIIIQPASTIGVIVAQATLVPTLNTTQKAAVFATRTELAQTEIAQGTQAIFVTVTSDTFGNIEVRGMPRTGFFNVQSDFMGGNAGPAGLAMVAMSAIGLVGVIVAARRLRVRDL